MQPIISKAQQHVAAWREDRRIKQQTVSFHVGDQDVLDVISYGGLKEHRGYIEVDGRYVRTLYISSYPYTAISGWLNQLVNFNHDVDISYYVEPIEANIALPKLNRKITELTATKQAMERSGKIIGSELLDPLTSAVELKDKIQRGQENLFQVSVYVTLSASSLGELDKTTTLLETLLAARLFYTKPATYQQIEGLQSVLPRADNQLGQKRNHHSSSAALMFPFISSELVQESGVLYGVNKSNNSLVILDRYALPNANSILFAQSGAGKSYMAKVEILRHLMRGNRVIVIDPEREYKKLAGSVDGTYIKLSAESTQKLNPFDLATATRSFGDLAEHTQDLTEVISLMVGGLDKSEAAGVDKAILKIYQEVSDEMPLLRDLYAELHKTGHLPLCERLEKYISGSLTGVFNEHTNIKLDNRLVVFDIKDLPETLRQIMMMIVSNFVQNEVKSRPEKRLLVIDEGWLLLQHEESARFISGLVRRARKYFLGVSIITQQANDFLNNNYGRAIASQSALRILMRQDTTTIQGVTTEFRLSEYEQRFLLTCERGEALIIADQHHVTTKIIASDEEHPLITTDPSEGAHARP